MANNTTLTAVIAGIVALIISGAVAVAIPHSSTAPKSGALAGPDIPFQYLNWGGVPQFVFAANLKSATTTPCAIQSPSATSTLDWAGVRVDTASSTATVWDIAQATTPYATTTAIGTAYNIAGGAQALINASSSPAAGNSTVFPPNTYLVFGVRQAITAGDATGAGFAPVGRCEASFIAYPTF